MRRSRKYRNGTPHGANKPNFV